MFYDRHSGGFSTHSPDFSIFFGLMNRLLHTIIACWTLLLLTSDLSAQIDAKQPELMMKAIRSTADRPPHLVKSGNTASPGISFPAGPLLQQLKKKPAALREQQFPTLRPGGQCEDSSFVKLIGLKNATLYVETVTVTANDNVLVSFLMWDSTKNLPYPSWINYGVLARLNARGDILWIKQFDDLTVSPQNLMYITGVIELPNGDIICSANWNTNNSSSTFNTLIYRLDANGNEIWRNTLQSNVGVFNSPPGTFTFDLLSAAEGLNGDLIVCGTTRSNLSSGKIETVVRLNSQGKLVWDANYLNYGTNGSYRWGAEGVSAMVQNGEVILIGVSHGSNYPQTPSAINISRLKYSDGTTITNRFFRPSYPDPYFEFYKGFSYWKNQWQRLDNGHYIFAGVLYSDASKSYPVNDHFGIVEFDAQFNLVNAYTISSTLYTNYYNTKITVAPSGKVLFTVLEFLDAYVGNVYFGSVENQQIVKERKVYLEGGMPGNNGFAIFKDKSHAYVQTNFQVDAASNITSYFEFRKMHDSDTASACLGTDTTLFSFADLNIIEDPGYYFYDKYIANVMTEFQQNLVIADTLTGNSINPCKQTSYCDTVSIHGNGNICGNTTYLDFTAFKNIACGARVLWSIDNNAVDSMRVTSDTSIRVWFKNMNWQGKLYASLTGSTCDMPAMDSMPVNIVRGQSPVSLGKDTVLCSQTTLQLNAGNTYSSYEWQDGSSNSTFTVSTSGMYWVHVRDNCGSEFKDTIIINPLNVTVDIGPDRIKCNADTIHLTAAAGFLNYKWSNNYNIDITTGPSVIVHPDTDTAYYLKAEKLPGCFAYDTVRVKVNHSPAISLGPDKSFCYGDSAYLDAGNGFQQYQWSNGVSTGALYVHDTGAYSVIATDAQGCSSYDTVSVTNVWPLPVVSLDKTDALCEGGSRILQAGSHSAYLWQDGSTGAVFNATSTGIYYVTVWSSQQCKNSDTMVISQILPAPQHFLPEDTAVCGYGSLEIRPDMAFSTYNWSNGAISPFISVIRPGEYSLQVTDANGCSGRDTILVKGKECLQGLHVPKGFTPNGDGRNDIFLPVLGGNVVKYQLTVYNRWGQAIFNTTDRFKGWDGKYGGLQQDSNVFVWVVSFQLEGEQVRVERGTVTLIR